MSSANDPTRTQDYELMAQFEKDFSGGRNDKEPKHLWRKGRIYQDGQRNNLFLAYRKGKSFGEASARLIAAPPELLEVLNALMVEVVASKLTGKYPGIEARMNEAKAAIAKARGGNHEQR